MVKVVISVLWFQKIGHRASDFSNFFKYSCRKSVLTRKLWVGMDDGCVICD